MALPYASPEPNPGFGWAQGDPATIQPRPHASRSPAQGDTDRKSHQHHHSLVPSDEARRWAEAFQFQNDCVEGGRIETSPKNKAALSLGKTDGHTDPLWGPDQLFCLVSATPLAAAKGRKMLLPRGWAAPSCSWALIREMMLVAA